MAGFNESYRGDRMNVCLSVKQTQMLSAIGSACYRLDVCHSQANVVVVFSCQVGCKMNFCLAKLVFKEALIFIDHSVDIYYM